MLKKSVNPVSAGNKTLLTILSLLLIVGCSKPIKDDTLIDKGGLKYHPDTKKLYSGEVFQNRRGSENAFEGSYKYGRKDGKWTLWYENGQKLSEETYKSGYRQGLGLYYTESGEIREIIYEIKSPVTDQDGNTYKTIRIGDQVWMAENLKVTHYRDGTAIPTGHSNWKWNNLSTGAYAVYDNNESNATTYGYLYNWFAAVDSRNIAPEGWHVPTDAEWQTLVDYLGGFLVAGGKMKEGHWNSPNTGATNESGFTALPGGYRGSNGDYYYMGYSGSFWSSTELDSSSAWYRELDYNGSDVYRASGNERDGFSVRCLRD